MSRKSAKTLKQEAKSVVVAMSPELAALRFNDRVERLYVDMIELVRRNEATRAALSSKLLKLEPGELANGIVKWGEGLEDDLKAYYAKGVLDTLDDEAEPKRCPIESIRIIIEILQSRLAHSHNGGSSSDLSNAVDAAHRSVLKDMIEKLQWARVTLVEYRAIMEVL